MQNGGRWLFSVHLYSLGAASIGPVSVCSAQGNRVPNAFHHAGTLFPLKNLPPVPCVQLSKPRFTTSPVKLPLPSLHHHTINFSLRCCLFAEATFLLVHPLCAREHPAETPQFPSLPSLALFGIRP